ncbi:MAG: hypothetical protein KAT70_06475 [Thermoplasmata archaeon]|nr:hypothetical protein [Thermoplasmata archaeon]
MGLIEFASMLVVGALLAAIGKGVTRNVFGSEPKAGRKGWRGVFYVTLWAHPILAGALLGLPAWLPAPTFMGDHLLGRVLWYALAGVFSSTAYDAIASLVKQRAGIKDGK